MADKYKTLPIGTIFTYEGIRYRVCNADAEVNICQHCAFNNMNCDINKDIRGNCIINQRTDKHFVYFEMIPNEDTNNCNTYIPLFKLDGTLFDVNVECPKGYSIDVERSDLSKGIIKFKNDNITFEDIYDNQGKDTFVTNVVNNNRPTYDKIAAIATLMDIANYYNKGWKPDFNNDKERKYYIGFSKRLNKYNINMSVLCTDTFVYFKNKEDAQAVIDNPNFKEILNSIYKD